MAQNNVNDLLAFLAVARERSFTKAAARLGVSQSALSHTIRRLEASLGVRLLMRTTRSVSTTDAGERLAQQIGPRFEEIEAELDALKGQRDNPAGTIRITAADHPVETILLPRLKPFLARYPDIKVEVTVDYGLTNIVEQRFDAGIRLGEQVGKDMIAVRIGPDWRFAVVGTPAYFAAHGRPADPRELASHLCINQRFPTRGDLWAWEFERDGREFTVRVDGQMTFNAIGPIFRAALEGYGLACVPLSMAEPALKQGLLEEVLDEWCPYLQGYHIYYPSRRQSSPAFNLLVDALRFRGP